MAILVFIFVIISTLFAIASGIWVAIALGNAISRNKRGNTSEDSAGNLKVE